MLQQIMNGMNNTSRKNTTEPKRADIQLEVFETTNYDMFKKLKGNRPIVKGYLVKLMASIQKVNLLSRNPIMVNAKMEIIDGQHRLEAAKGLQVPIYYMVVDAGDLATVQLLNSNIRQWGTNDYLYSYIATGVKSYIEFEKFITEYRISAEAGFLLMLNDNRKTIYDKFKAGEFTFTDEELAEAKKKVDMMQEIQRHFTEGYPRSKQFYRAFNLIWSKDLAETLKEKLNESGKSLIQMWSVKDYLRVFEDVLNYNKKGSNLIRLY